MKYLGNFINSIFLSNRVLYVLLGIVGIFCIGFPFAIFFLIAKILLLAVGLLSIVDLALLYGLKNPLEAKRTVEDKFSNGDYNPVTIQIRNKYAFGVSIEVIDELPDQFQIRDKKFTIKNIAPNKEETIQYKLRPTTRGDYHFYNINIFIGTFLGIFKRRQVIQAQKTVLVYPSFIQMKKYSFLTISNRLEEVGVRKVRKLGLSHEFEQIREYVKGDDFKLINWKATAKRNSLMVNQFQEEKSQNIYCIIDKGRTMHMPFNGMSLIDYSINAALVLSNIATGRGDKSGLVTFSDKIGSFIKAKGGNLQMNYIVESLYKQSVRLKESDFIRLYKNIKIKIKKRSLLILFSNFDSMVSLNRQLPYLKALNKNHLLCLIMFDNTEMNALVNEPASTNEMVFQKSSAEKFVHEKRLIVKELKKNGIYVVLTEPNNLTINTINAYIQIKAKNAI